MTIIVFAPSVILSAGIAIGRKIVGPVMNLIRYNMWLKPPSSSPLLLVSLSAGIALGREVMAPLMNLIRCNMGFKLVVPSIIEVILTSVTCVVQ